MLYERSTAVMASPKPSKRVLARSQRRIGFSSSKSQAVRQQARPTTGDGEVGDGA
jgi:hypothetical protein